MKAFYYSVYFALVFLYGNMTSFDNATGENLEIIKVIPFNGTIPSSITVDPISNLLYISVRPDYSANYLSQSCSGEQCNF
jgi:hypothetical protein